MAAFTAVVMAPLSMLAMLPMLSCSMLTMGCMSGSACDVMLTGAGAMLMVGGCTGAAAGAGVLRMCRTAAFTSASSTRAASASACACGSTGSGTLVATGSLAASPPIGFISSRLRTSSCVIQAGDPPEPRALEKYSARACMDPRAMALATNLA